MQPSDRRRAFARARGEVVRRQTRLMRDTRAALLELLAEAERQILAELAQAGDDATRWRLERLQREVRRAMEEFSRDGAAAAGRASEGAWHNGEALVDEPLTAAGYALQGMQALDTRALAAMREFLTDKIRDIGVDAADRINTQLGLALLGAQTPFEAVRSITRILGESARDRATVIVRTELGRAFSAAAQARLETAAARVPGLRKQWRRSGKIHSRPEHDAADGQIVDVDQAFVIHTKDGPVRLRYPRDPKGPPGQTINCGCTLLPVLPDAQVDTPGRRPFTEEERRLNPAKLDFDERVRLSAAVRR